MDSGGFDEKLLLRGERRGEKALGGIEEDGFDGGRRRKGCEYYVLRSSMPSALVNSQKW